MYARQQDETTGKSPLMAAAEGGFVEICKLLLDHGAPWNALDRFNQCAGNFATEKQHWDVVNLLVDPGTAAKLLL
jgi:protein arginine N-methyltransferase 2